MKKIYSLLIALIFASNLSAQGSINFDDASKWVQDGTTLFTSYANHGYADTNFTATGASVVRQTTSAQDGFPGAIGTYSFRLNQTATTALTMTVLSGGVGDFSVKIRRWDSTPATNFKVEYSVDGTNWTTVLANTSTVTTDSDWKTVVGTINSTNNNIQVRIASQGTTERLMVDDFSWTAPGTAQPVLSASPSNINFGNITLSTTSAAQNITVTGANLTTAPTYTVTGTDAAMFSATGTLTTTGGTINVTFTPTSTGAKTATLTVTSGTLSSTITLTGTGFTAGNPYNLDDSAPLGSLAENFESGTANTNVSLPGWTNVAVQGARLWDIKSFGGNKYAQMSSFGGTGTYQTLLISPAVDLNQIQKSNVTFDWNSGYANGAELKVYVIQLVNGTMQSTLLQTINDTVNTAGYGAAFTTVTLDLSAFSGTAFLAFEYNGVAGTTTTTYQIDNVNMPAVPLAVSDITSVKSNFVKNTQVKEEIFFGTKGDVKIYSMNGQVVKAASVNEYRPMNVADLAPGMYIVTGMVDGQPVSQKILKK